MRRSDYHNWADLHSLGKAAVSVGSSDPHPDPLTGGLREGVGEGGGTCGRHDSAVNSAHEPPGTAKEADGWILRAADLYD